MSSILALTSACGTDESASPATTEAATTAEVTTTAGAGATTTGANANAPAHLPYLELPPPELRPGLVRTSGDFEPVTVFRVPQGWNGNQDDNGFAIGEGVNVEAEEFDRSSIFVVRIGAGDVPVERAMARFEKLRGLIIVSQKPARVGGFSGRTYNILVIGEHVLLERIDSGLIGADIPHGKHQVTFLDVRGQTLMIDLSGVTEADRREAQEVLDSFKFPK